jgi:hypothetical protein
MMRYVDEYELCRFEEDFRFVEDLKRCKLQRIYMPMGARGAASRNVIFDDA